MQCAWTALPVGRRIHNNRSKHDEAEARRGRIKALEEPAVGEEIKPATPTLEWRYLASMTGSVARGETPPPCLG